MGLGLGLDKQHKLGHGRAGQRARRYGAIFFYLTLFLSSTSMSRSRFQLRETSIFALVPYLTFFLTNDKVDTWYLTLGRRYGGRTPIEEQLRTNKHWQAGRQVLTQNTHWHSFCSANTCLSTPRDGRRREISYHYLPNNYFNIY